MTPAVVGSARGTLDPSMRRLARGGMLNMAGSAVAAASQFVLIGVVARNVDDAMASAFFVLLAFAQLAVVIPNLGAGTGLVYFLSRRRATADVLDLSGVLRTALVPVVAVSAAVGIAVFAMAGSVAGWLGLDGIEGATAAVRVMALAVPAFALLLTMSAACRGLGSYAVTVATEQLLVPLGQLVLVFFATGAGLLAMTTGWAVPVVAAATVASVALVLLHRRLLLQASAVPPRRESAETDPVEGPPEGVGRSFWGYTAPIGVVNVLKAIVQRADVIALGILAAPVQVVMYVAASRYLVLAQVANRAMFLTLQPRVASAMATGDKGRAAEAYTAGTAWLVLVSWPVSIGCMLFPASLLQIVGGPSLRSGAAILVILSASMLLAAACGNVEAVLEMTGRSRFNLVTAALGAAVNVCLLVLLIPTHGPEGAAWAWAAAVVVGNLWPLLALVRLEGLHPFGRRTLLAMALSTASALGVGGVVRLVWGDRVSALLGAVVAAGAVHLAGVWLFRRQLALGGLRGPRGRAR